MPTPKPSEETEQEWMSRCVPVVIEEGRSQDEAVAQCLNVWNQSIKICEDTREVILEIKKTLKTLEDILEQIDEE